MTKRAPKLPVGPGPAASGDGTPIQNGQALQVVCYPRERTKMVLVAAAEAAEQSLSGFLLLAALEKAARMRGLLTGVECTAHDLVPAEDYAELRRKRGGKSKKGKK